MADKIIMVDTSILIDYYRKTNKANSVWIALVREEYKFVISAITKYEIYSGANQSQLNFWNAILQAIEIIPFDEASVDAAVDINASLKKKRKQIELADLFIASSAVVHNFSLATLNKKHFIFIENLSIIE